MARDLVLVTGGSGFVAKYCIAELLAQGYGVRTSVRALAREGEVRAAVEKLLGGKTIDVEETLDCVVADLMADEGWGEAMAGCRYVLHVASPFPVAEPKQRDTLIGPARDGTLRVLKAAKAAGVQRVVVTSSIAAICYGAPLAEGEAVTEEQWTDPTRKELTAYLVSKTLAERAAWAWLEGEGAGMELAVINPGVVLGPAVDQATSSSLEVIRVNVSGEYPALPNVRYPVTDVRDVASLHVVAMTKPEAAGERFLCVSETMSVKEILAIVAQTLPDLSKKVPRFQVPDFVIRGLALFDRSARAVIPDLGRTHKLDNSKARDKLGFVFKPGDEAVRAAAQSLRDLKLI